MSWPLSGLLVLAGSAFVTILTEALPAGVLPAMSTDPDVTEARAGLLITVYALAAALTAIPMTAWTLILPRRTLLLALLLGFAATNVVTAMSTGFALTLAARVVCGVFAGLLWAMVPAYAARLAPQRSGKAIATALAGMTVGLSLGIPAGTALGGLIGWRAAFGLLTVLAVALAGTALWRLPQLAGEAASRGMGPMRTIRTPGIPAINITSLLMVLGSTCSTPTSPPSWNRQGWGSAPAPCCSCSAWVPWSASGSPEPPPTVGCASPRSACWPCPPGAWRYSAQSGTAPWPWYSVRCSGA
ncbi:MFS transporter [Streptomyces sp. NPDC087845]|uniref:MFS transporter n=1 Tax=Streptomyces sp. NPDC087845 TaxID=3365806 RepID=UPI003810D618